YLIVKNLAGVVFVVAGIVMLFMPGQGILTILIGVMLMNFPGKRLLELRTISQPSVLGAINWVRARSQRPPLALPRTYPLKQD
ncbi:MAG: PGPGW domain-containing protein, partial [Syntrophales bacterium]|nr:PGPGW domain-containing protein [Syntrophales bacterium]